MKGIEMIDNYKALPIGKYLEICDICRNEEDELQRQVKVLSVLSDRGEDELLNLPIAQYRDMAARSRFLEEQSKEDHSRIARKYILGDWELVPTMDYRKVTTAQYYDFQTYSQEGEKNLVQVLSCFLVPKGKKYNDGYDIIAVQDAIRSNLSVSDVLSLFAFFFKSFGLSIKDFLTYSMKEARKIKDRKAREAMVARIQEQMASLGASGDGSQT